jgi:hypothetical protein
MGKRLARNLGPVTALQAAEWTSETVTGAPAICCPGCAAIVDFDAERFQIDLAGHVAPRWSCAGPLCSYREWITLSGFGEDA